MAFDIANSILDPQDSSCYAQLGWHYDFYFGYGCDVIEEDALNERYCIEVLRILITKTDTEINELEKDLVSLQSELAWAEYKEWPDKCCNALRKKIDSLHISARSLKSKDKNNMGVHLSIKPAESLHEIMKYLLRDLFHEKIKQNEEPQDVVVLDSSHSQGQATEDLEENKKCFSAGSSVIIKEEMKESCVTPMENCSMLKTSSTVQEYETNYSGTVKLGQLVSNFSQPPLELAAGRPHEEIVLASLDFEIARKGEMKEHDFTPKKKKKVQDSSSKAADERIQNLDMFEVQPADINLKNSCRYALKHAVTYSKKKKPLNISDSNIINEEAKDNSSISAADVQISNSSLNSMGKSTNIGKTVKLVNTVVKDSGSNACRSETGLCIEMNKTFMSGLELSTNHTICDRSKLLTSSLNSEGKENPPKADKPANAYIKADALRNATGLSKRGNTSDSKLTTSSGQANTNPGIIVKVENADGSPAALRHATGLNQKRNNCDSRLGAYRQENGGNCDINQKLCDFALKVARKRNIKESNFTPADKTEAEGNKKHSQIIVKVEKVDLTNTRHSTLTSILELQDGKGKESTKTTLPEEGSMQPQFQLAETASNNEKRKTETSLLNVQEPVFVSAEMVSNSPSILKAKGRWKAGLGSDSSGSNQSWDRKIKKENFHNGLCEAEENSSALKYYQNLNLRHQKKRKKNPSLPVVVEIKGSTLQLDFSKSQSEPGKDDIYSVDSCTEAVPPSLPCAILNNLKVVQLRAIAKEKKLTKYYKLRKSDLIEQIANHLRC